MNDKKDNIVKILSYVLTIIILLGVIGWCAYSYRAAHPLSGTVTVVTDTSGNSGNTGENQTDDGKTSSGENSNSGENDNQRNDNGQEQPEQAEETIDITARIFAQAVNLSYSLSDNPEVATYLCVNESYSAENMVFPYVITYGITSNTSKSRTEDYIFSGRLSLTEESKRYVANNTTWYAEHPEMLNGIIDFTNEFDLGYYEVAKLFLYGETEEEQYALIHNEFILVWASVLRILPDYGGAFFKFDITATPKVGGKKIEKTFTVRLDDNYLYKDW